MFRRLLVIFTLGALAGVMLSFMNPVGSRLLKLVFVASVGGGWLGLLVLFWRRRVFRMGWLLMPVLLAVPFLLPGRELDTEAVRADYVRRMEALVGTRYFWGGESSRGIDCSGLPRRALGEALFWHGVAHLNGRSLRLALEQWWYDAGAEALGQGYRGYTRPLGLKGTVAKMDYAGLAPGDLAVTTNGGHVLAYLGGDRWIQSDLGIGKVAILNGRTDENLWFATLVTLHRWKVLEKK